MSAGGGSGVETRLRPPDPIWREPCVPDRDAVRRLVSALRLPEALCAVLVARGLGDVEEAKRFLRPRLGHLHDPALLADGEAAAERIARAIRTGETILVHGDYDVDGICATALLTRWLTDLGAVVIPFVPHRLRDGYDFTTAGLAAARAAGASLVVTADCGIAAHAAVGSARQAGIDVVVTDHHTVFPELPAAVAVVDPRRPDCAYPEKELCGTGVAFKLCALVASRLGADAEGLHEYLDLVAIATIADLVPLTGENRVLVSYGLRRLAQSRVAGLRALLAVSDVAEGDVSAGKVAFLIAPRINAAGRVGESMDALRLLVTDDEREARELAERLDRTNRTRQEEDQRTLVDALGLLEARYDPARDYGVVLWSEGWHPGVIGLAASRLAERIHRPVVLVAIEGARGRGSARSVAGFHLYEALRACARHLSRFGGHRHAAGMDIETRSLAAFEEDFNATARERLRTEDLRPMLAADVEIELGAADLELARWLSYLGPHGVGNPGPLFLARGVKLEAPRLVGAKHLKARLTAPGARLDAVGFGLAERHAPESLDRGVYDVLFRVERDEWQGSVRARARLVDLRPCAGAAARAS